jgi:hypothetical protein
MSDELPEQPSGALAPPVAPRRNSHLRPPWKPGQSGNPRGRVVGNRKLLEEDFLKALVLDFRANGKEAIERCRMKDPVQYVRIIASLMPKSLNVQAVSDKRAAELTEDELVAMVMTPSLPAPIDVEPIEPSPAIEADEP